MAEKIKGITIDIGGDTSQLNKALAGTNKEISSTQKELKEVERLLKLDPTNTELLAQKQTLLSKNIETSKTKVEALRKAKAEADEAMKNGTAVNEKMYRQLQREIVKSENAIDSMNDEIERTADEVEKSAKKTPQISKGFTVAKGIVSNFVSNELSSVVSKMGEIIEETREYREDMNKLNTAFKTSGHTVKSAKEVYSDFYNILGESDRSVEAVNHLAKFVETEQDLAKWGDIAAGVTATFGDSLPIEGLTEAANETTKVGKVTGVLADALNWAGINEDAFNEKLEKCNSEQERSQLITETLNSTYQNAAATYKEMNADIIAGRDATQKLTEAQAALASAVEPVINNVKGWFADLAYGAAESFGLIKGETEAFLESAESARNAIEENTIQQLAQVESAKSLYEELKTLADENGRVDESNRARAEYIVSELNSALGLEIKMNGNIISSLDGISTSIDEVIKKKQAEILLQGQEEKYKDAVEKRTDAYNELVEKYDEIIEKRREIEAIESKPWETRTDAENRSLESYKMQLYSLKQEYEDLAENVEIYDQDMRKYSEATAKALEGDVQGVISILSEEGEMFQTAANVAADTAEEKKQILGQQLIDAVSAAEVAADAYRRTNSEENKKLLEDAQAHTEACKEQYELVGGAIADGTIVGLEGKKVNLKSSLENLMAMVPDWAKKLLKISSPSKLMRDEVGANVALGVVEGMNQKAPAVKKASADTVDVVKKTFTGKDGFDIHSPSKWTEWVGEMLDEGLAEGIEKNTSAEDAAKKKAGNIKSILSGILSDVDTESDIAKEEFDYWKSTNPYATADEIRAKETGRDNILLNNQQRKIDASEAAYNKAVKEGLEESVINSLRKDLLTEKNAYEDLKKSTDKTVSAVEKLNSVKSDATDNIDIAKGRYEYWNVTHPEAKESEKYTKQLEYMSVEMDEHGKVLDALNDAYDESCELTGRNSEESKKLLKQIIEEKIAYEKLKTAIKETNEVRAESVKEETNSGGYNYEKGQQVADYYKWLAEEGKQLSEQGISDADIKNAASLITGYQAPVYNNDNSKSVVINQTINNPTSESAYEVKKNTVNALDEAALAGGNL